MARHTAGFFFAKIAKSAKKAIDKINKTMYNIDKQERGKKERKTMTMIEKLKIIEAANKRNDARWNGKK